MPAGLAQDNCIVCDLFQLEVSCRTVGVSRYSMRFTEILQHDILPSTLEYFKCELGLGLGFGSGLVLVIGFGSGLVLGLGLVLW